ncbi:AAA family ATPase [Paraburkholderia sp. 1N]|uniref:AAA family ATPase n=1 Tax=Paraburkholderia solitsugae TaxID=2675748 RepID=A0ABX2C229_9BURK|nr:ATP-binding protein [Paraburkholderia solitsugae]NPT42375.1 AAA family ATPase [Paraburkholderia solitsugae]NPT46268.1 AAA family ATPase [Paraburkholderia solitsugae]
MNGLFRTPVGLTLRLIFVGLFILSIVHSPALGYLLGAAQRSQLLSLTLMAAVSVWVQDRRSGRWASAAFLVLSVGLLRIALPIDRLSGYGLAIWGLAAGGILIQRYWLRKQAAKGRSTANAGAAAQLPRHRSEPSQPVYLFDQNVQQARYRFADLVGMGETKKRMLAAGEDIVRGSGNKRNGVLLFGDPGNGKTLFAEALAGELKVPFMSITYGDVASKWINETPQKIDAMFRTARRLGACVLFIDEFDSFTKPRDEGGHSMDRDMANVMLTNINNLHGTRVVLVAATNFIDKLDPAAIRDGRFDYKIEIPPPDMEARVAILRKSIGESLGSSFVEPVAITSLAERWSGFSASRLTSIGGQLADMRRDGKFGAGKVTFDLGMRAMRLIQGRKGKLPEDVKSIDEIIMPGEARTVLRDMAYRMQQVHNLEKMGGSLPRGAIFFGPPGTGKTQAAMALAQASGWAFLMTTGAKLVSNPNLWGRLVREAKDIRPAIVFIEEADDTLLDRRYSNVARLTNEILATVDGVDGRVRDVMYIAATNHYDRLDSAVLRGGRFEEKVRFDVPEPQDMRAYLGQKLAKVAGNIYTVAPGVLDRCVAVLAGRSIADADAVIAQAINFAAVRALRGAGARLCPGDMSAAAQVVFGENGQATARPTYK